MTSRFTLVFIPAASFLVIALAVSPYNPNGSGGYGEAWPDLAAIWIALAIFLVMFWLLRVKAPGLGADSHIPGVAVFVSGVAAMILGAVGLQMAVGVTGFSSEYQDLMLWSAMTIGMFLLASAVLFRDAIVTTRWGAMGYSLSVVLGIVSVSAAIGLSIMLLLIPSSGVI